MSRRTHRLEGRRCTRQPGGSARAGRTIDGVVGADRDCVGLTGAVILSVIRRVDGSSDADRDRERVLGRHSDARCSVGRSADRERRRERRGYECFGSAGSRVRARRSLGQAWTRVDRNFRRAREPSGAKSWSARFRSAWGRAVQIAQRVDSEISMASEGQAIVVRLGSGDDHEAGAEREGEDGRAGVQDASAAAAARAARAARAAAASVARRARAGRARGANAARVAAGSTELSLQSARTRCPGWPGQHRRPRPTRQQPRRRSRPLRTVRIARRASRRTGGVDEHGIYAVNNAVGLAEVRQFSLRPETHDDDVRLDDVGGHIRADVDGDARGLCGQ